MKKKVRPHGKYCGCEKRDSYSPALGCSNPNRKLKVRNDIQIGDQHNEMKGLLEIHGTIKTTDNV